MVITQAAELPITAPMRDDHVSFGRKKRSVAGMSSGQASDRPILPVSPQADARARRFEKDVRQERNREYAVIIDNDTGQVIGDRIPGERTRTRFTGKQLQDMKGNVLSHNHPAGWSYPEGDPRHDGAGFSIADVRMMADWQLAEVRAVTPRFLYRLRPPQDPDSNYRRLVDQDATGEIAAVVTRVFLDASDELASRVAMGETAPEEADVLVNYEAMLRLVQEWGVEYEREVLP